VGKGSGFNVQKFKVVGSLPEIILLKNVLFSRVCCLYKDSGTTGQSLVSIVLQLSGNMIILPKIKSLADPKGAQGTGLKAHGRDSLPINKQHFMANVRLSYPRFISKVNL